jgi:hypothetical protein
MNNKREAFKTFLSTGKTEDKICNSHKRNTKNQRFIKPIPLTGKHLHLP